MTYENVYPIKYFVFKIQDNKFEIENENFENLRKRLKILFRVLFRDIFYSNLICIHVLKILFQYEKMKYFYIYQERTYV